MSKRVAVIDDDDALRNMMVLALAEDGYEPLPLHDAREAATFLRTAGPDLIVLDVHLERRELGWSLLSLLWLDPVLNSIPVIVCSGDRRELAARRGQLEAQHCRILHKPFELDEFLGAVEQLLGPAARAD